MDVVDYKHIVLGLLFLKHISNSFEPLHQKFIEDKDEYLAENIFFVPKNAQWEYIKSQSTQPDIGELLDSAMEAIEKENPQLKGILPKVFAQQKVNKSSLRGLIDLIGSAELGDTIATAEQLNLDVAQDDKKLSQGDILGRVYEYFLGEFALSDGRNSGQFYTPESIVKLLVEIVEPYQGKVYDPCCGSGGMFVWSEKFLKHHQRRVDSISIYGQESNETSWRLCKMSLVIRSIDASQIKWNNEGSFLNDSHSNLKADFILANPPYNSSDWGRDLLENDERWLYGKPSASNANFAWIQHIIYHLNQTGCAGVVMSNNTLSSNAGGEGEIRKNIVKADLVDCIVVLPTQLFFNTGIPACLWILRRNKNYKQREVLFIDGSKLGYMINRRNRCLSDDDVFKVAGTYRQWKQEKGNYQDVKGFCKSASLADIEKHNFVLTPGRYVGIPNEEDDGILFEDKMTKLTQELGELMREGLALDNEIKRHLSKLGFKVENSDEVY